MQHFFLKVFQGIFMHLCHFWPTIFRCILQHFNVFFYGVLKSIMSGGEVIGREGSPPLQHHQSVSTASAACAATHALPAAHRPLPPGGAVLHAHCVCGGCIWAANVLRGDQGHLHGDPLNKQKENRKSTWKGIFSVLHIKHEIRPNLTYSLDFWGGFQLCFWCFSSRTNLLCLCFPPIFPFQQKLHFIPFLCLFSVPFLIF